MQYSLARNAQFQELGTGGGSIILDLETGQIYTCNSSATDILKHIAAHRGLDETIDALLVKYNIDRVILKREIKTLIDELLANSLIVVVDA